MEGDKARSVGGCLRGSQTPGILPSPPLQTRGPQVSCEGDEAGGTQSVGAGTYKLKVETPSPLPATQLLERRTPEHRWEAEILLLGNQLKRKKPIIQSRGSRTKEVLLHGPAPPSAFTSPS